MARTAKQTDKELAARYVADDFDRYPGGRADARLRDSGVSVWAIVAFMRVYDSDLSRIADHFGLSADEIEGALAYYRLNKRFVDARITLNEA